MIYLSSLAVFSGLSLNLLVQFALGTAGIAGDSINRSEARRPLPLFQFWILFVSIISLWFVFSFLTPIKWISFSQYFLFFPFSALTCMALEFLLRRSFSIFGGAIRTFSARTAYEGLLPVSLAVTVALAGNFLEAFVLALFFVLGNIAAMLILNEILRRSTLERVPAFLRGGPLVLISMGLLSLIFGVAAGICFRILEVF